MKQFNLFPVARGIAIISYIDNTYYIHLRKGQAHIFIKKKTKKNSNIYNCQGDLELILNSR